MALRAVIEVAVHVESFRNIDLFHQGLYHLKARLRSDPASARAGGDAGAGGDGVAASDGATPGNAAGSPGAGGGAGGAGGALQAAIAAAPCGALSADLCAAASAAPAGTKAEGDDDEDNGGGGGSSTAGPSKVQRKGSKQPARPDHHNLIPAHIIDDQGSYSTRSFLIRYCEEEVELNDIGEFRWEVAAEDLDTESGPSVILEVDLMFADLGQHGGADRFGESPDVDSTEFKCVSTARFRLCGAARGMHEYVPVIFDEYHCCMACCSVHSTLLDFRVRLHPSLPSGPASAANGGADADDAMAEAPSTSQPAPQLAGAGAGASGPAKRGPAPAPPAALSIEEALRGPTGAGPRDKLLQRMEAFCQRHIDLLAAARRKLGEWHGQMSKECLLPPQRELLALSTAPANGVASFDSSGGRNSGGGGDSGRHGRRLEERMTPGAAAAALALNLNEAACDVSRTWHTSLAVLLQAPREATLCLRRSWERDSVRRWATTIIKEPPRADLAACKVEDSCAIHSTSAEGLRRAAGEKDRGIELELGVQDLSGIWSMEARPLIFEEQYLGGGAAASKPPRGGAPIKEDEEEPLDLPPSVPKKYEGVHLIVLVHGFQGNSFDMRLMKNNLALLYPDSIFLASSCNEDNTEGDINEMGVRLAQEVVNYICDWCPSGALGRLSFITHSLGGLIARAALPMLQEYSSKMFTFLSLSSCHLGVFQDRMSLFNTGFWVLKKWRQSTFLQQVSMGDHDNPRETFLYKLSRSRGIENFRHIVLTSCYEDQYGQLQSARAELCPEWAGQSDKEVYKEMVENIWSSVHPEQLLRLDMNFVIAEKNLDAFIGRTAHIQFLECQQMMRMLVHNYSGLFR